MDLPIVIIWESPLSFVGPPGVIFFIPFLDEIPLLANRIAPDGMPHSVTSHQGLYCLPKSHIKDAGLIRFANDYEYLYN